MPTLAWFLIAFLFFIIIASSGNSNGDDGNYD